jgi:hypothetical protein
VLKTGYSLDGVQQSGAEEKEVEKKAGSERKRTSAKTLGVGGRRHQRSEARKEEAGSVKRTKQILALGVLTSKTTKECR